tara:strand:- start:619 stop:1491 length:873 start_codon:yes stop_codon:yes gene_type:complete
MPFACVAGTIVRISTSIGDFSIELFDDSAPITVRNFLNYVERNDYNGTYFHRVIDDFVAQGGAYRFQPYVGPIDVLTDPPIVNEFNVSNSRGTVAMAKLDGNPDSATNQWFVNLADNVNLDTLNGGFTVLGVVLGDGMTIVDAIDNQPTVNLGYKAESAPYVKSAYTDPTDFVYMNVEIVTRYSGAPHVFESNSGLLITSVDIDNGSDLLSMNFSVVQSEEDLVIQVNADSVMRRRGPVEGVASFNSANGEFRIPLLEVNSGNGVTVARNVIFTLTKTSPVQFTLKSFEQ